MIYLIENRIVFNPEDNTLSLQDDVENQVSISNPARRILLLLIEQQGTVVQRDVFFKKVWDDYGLVSSNNNLNHCISKLRKVIHTLGHADDVIVTVPKVGFLLKKEITISTIDLVNDLSPLENENENTSIESAEMLSDGAITPEKSPPIRVEVKHHEQDEQPKQQSKIALLATPKKIHILLMIGATFLALILALGLFLHDRFYDPKVRLQIGSMGRCGLYSTMPIPSSQHADFIQQAQEIIDKNNIICNPGNIFIFQSEAMVSLIKSGATREFLAECALGSDNNPIACLSVYVNDRRSNDNR